MAVASALDLGLMKLGAVTSRAARRDFVDLFLLSKLLPLREMLERSRSKFGHVRDFPLQALKGLTDLASARDEPIPTMNVDVAWSDVEAWVADRGARSGPRLGRLGETTSKRRAQMTDLLITNIAELATPTGTAYRKGADQARIERRQDVEILCRPDSEAWAASPSSAAPRNVENASASCPTPNASTPADAPWCPASSTPTPTSPGPAAASREFAHAPGGQDLPRDRRGRRRHPVDGRGHPRGVARTSWCATPRSASIVMLAPGNDHGGGQERLRPVPRSGAQAAARHPPGRRGAPRRRGAHPPRGPRVPARAPRLDADAPLRRPDRRGDHPRRAPRRVWRASATSSASRAYFERRAVAAGARSRAPATAAPGSAPRRRVRRLRRRRPGRRARGRVGGPPGGRLRGGHRGHGRGGGRWRCCCPASVSS